MRVYDCERVCVCAVVSVCVCAHACLCIVLSNLTHKYIELFLAFHFSYEAVILLRIVQLLLRSADVLLEIHLSSEKRHPMPESLSQSSINWFLFLSLSFSFSSSS